MSQTEWNRLVYKPAERWHGYFSLQDPGALMRLAGVWWDDYHVWGNVYAERRYQGRTGGKKLPRD